MSNLVHGTGADTENYVARDTRKLRALDTSKGPRAFMADALIAEGPAEPTETERPATTPVITSEMIEANYARVKAGASNTLVTIHPDGTRSYKHDVVNRGDGIKDTLGTDRGKGTTDSLDMLRKEGAVRVEGLLDKRGSNGRFKKGG
jgi:hypothetical protein